MKRNGGRHASTRNVLWNAESGDTERMETQQWLDDYAALPDEAQRQVADFVAVLRRRYDAPTAPDARADFEREPFVGMWREREDFADSTAWVRDVRASQWSRK